MGRWERAEVVAEDKAARHASGPEEVLWYLAS